jgi:CRISPR/Cas system-associated exonuclease Cas4 (RecB family)
VPVRKKTTTGKRAVSRSKIELFVQCQRCFYLELRLGVKRPSMPAFTLNNAIDHLLKKEFDVHRAEGTRHPLMAAYGLAAVPFDHPELPTWRHNFTGVRTFHTESGLTVFGAVDDIWKDTATGELIVVDYKATASSEPITLTGKWKEAYKRQMEIYQWLLRENGFSVATRGYFVYVNGDADRAAFDGKLECSVVLLPYDGTSTWVSDTVCAMAETLARDTIPSIGAECEHCAYREAAGIAFKKHVEQTKA